MRTRRSENGCVARSVITRREFVRFGAATLAVSPAALMAADAAGGACRTAGERLRIGILSDIHLKVKADKAKFVRALRAFRDERVDGVLICGDLADNGVVPQLQYVADAWESVFPRSQGVDGSHVERIFICGDHDTGGYAHRVSFFKCGTWLMKHYKCTEAELNALSLATCCAKEWQRIFGEPWSPIVHKRVKGYDFVLSHFTRKGWNSALGLDAFLKDFKPDPSKPFFYAQHRVLRDTACGPKVWGQDDGSAKKLLSAYPNCCAFFGHSHQTAVREDAIWQGAFTAVQVPSLRYVTHEPEHANKPNGYSAEQGLMLSVYDDRMSVRRLDFVNGRPLAAAWTIPLIGGERPFVHERRRAAAIVPEFPAGAKLAAKVREVERKKGARGKDLELTFPSVTGLHGGVRAYDYLATVTIESGEKSQKNEKRFFSPKCDRSPEADTEDVNVRFPLDDVAGWKSLRVSVRPREIFGGLGAPLEVDV